MLNISRWGSIKKKNGTKPEIDESIVKVEMSIVVLTFRIAVEGWARRPTPLAHLINPGFLSGL